MHLLPESVYPFPAEMEQAFQDSSRVVFEVDLNMASPARISQAFSGVGVYPLNDTLANHLSAETLAKLMPVLNYLGYSFEAVQRFRPAFLAGMITERLAQRAGFVEHLGVDHYFYGEAIRAHKPVLGLETLQAQTDVFALDDNKGELNLRLTIENLLTCSILLNQMATAWKTGDANGLDQLLN
jgi:hypothetical protein